MLWLPIKAARSRTEDNAYVSSQTYTLVDQSGASICSADGKSISSDSTAGTLADYTTQTLEVESLDTEKGHDGPAAAPIRPTRWKIPKRVRTCAIGAGIILGLWILPNTILGVFSYYSYYIGTFFNSRASVYIRRTVHTEAAFTAFFWIFTFKAFLLNIGLGLVIFGLGQRLAKEVLRLTGHIATLWMSLWAAASIIVVFACFWLPPVTSVYYQARVFNHGCANRGWDLDIALQSSTTPGLSEVGPFVGNASISQTAYPHVHHIAQLIRHVDNPLRFDFVPSAFTTGSTFSNITYDWQNTTYTAFRPDSTNVTGNFMTNPNLVIPSLNVSTLDDFIPFQRPSYKPCWPPTATLITWNSTGLSSSKVLETLTSLNNTLIKVCANASPDVVEQMQISLGVVFIDHFYYSLCKTRSGTLSASNTSSPDTNLPNTGIPGDDDDDQGGSDP